MITATVLVVFFVPLFYVLVVSLFERKPKESPDTAQKAGENA